MIAFLQRGSHSDSLLKGSGVHLQGNSLVALVEVLLIFALFALQGAWPVPDVNECYYLGKAIHFWNPDWLAGDTFMESADTHQVFYFTFGWLSLWLSPAALAWTGRVVAWLLLAWSWRRLSFAALPRRWWSILTAALFAFLMERFHMAGEWVIGGVEAKCFAYVFVFLGLEGLLRDRWNRALVLFGAAAAFHVLVGGWAVVAAGIAWLMLKFRAPQITLPSIRSLLPGIFGGFLLALFGVVPCLWLDWGVDAETLRQAHQIYVFDRLPHHLVLTGIRTWFIVRLILLWIFWLLLPRLVAPEPPLRILRAFVAGAVCISIAGVAIHALIPLDRALAADLLRFYWFRLTDVALPLGVALEVAVIIAVSWSRLSELLRVLLAATIAVAVLHFGIHAAERISPGFPRSHRIADYPSWRAACDWVADSGEIPENARFLTPRLSQTFKWHTGRSEAATWKDVPQNAEAIVAWWRCIQDLHAGDATALRPEWRRSYTELNPERLRELGKKYNAQYVLTDATDPPLDLKLLYRNKSYAIYRLQ